MWDQLRYHDVELGRDGMWLRPLRARAMASSAWYPDTVGSDPLHRAGNLHAELTTPIDPEWKSRRSPAGIHQDPA